MRSTNKFTHLKLQRANYHYTLKRIYADCRQGCLSLPNITVKVKRAEEIICRALNENNELITFEASELLAMAIQHEVDHLMGKLIIDYLPLWKRAALRKKIKALQSKK